MWLRLQTQPTPLSSDRFLLRSSDPSPPCHWGDVVSENLAILFRTMASENPAQQPSGSERREYYRITVTLPIRIQRESDQTEGLPVEQSVNLSGGGIGVTITEVYQPNDILVVTLGLPEHGLFTAFVEVLRLDPIPYPGGRYRLHARFIRMPAQDREVLIRFVTRFQRDHLQDHYLA